MKTHRTTKNSYGTIINSIKLYQLHNLIVSLLVIEQIHCLRVEMKDDNLCFQTMQKSCEKIQLLRFYIQFECIYPNIEWKLLLACYATFYNNKRRRKQSKATWITWFWYGFLCLLFWTLVFVFFVCFLFIFVYYYFCLSLHKCCKLFFNVVVVEIFALYECMSVD